MYVLLLWNDDNNNGLNNNNNITTNNNNNHNNNNDSTNTIIITIITEIEWLVTVDDTLKSVRRPGPAVQLAGAPVCVYIISYFIMLVLNNRYIVVD